MKKLHLIAACIAISGLAASCSKSYNDTPTVSPSYSSMEDVFTQLSVQPKVTTVDAGVDNIFYGNSGTRYFFPANCFTTASGAAVTGKVQISSVEYTDKGDMLFSKMLPISNKEPLFSGGEINVSAAQNGQKLYMKGGAYFAAFVPFNGTVPANIDFFSGQPNTDTTQFKTNWVKPDSNVGHKANMIVMTNPDTFNIISDSLRQCNADAFMPAPVLFQIFTVTIQVNGASLDPASKVYGYTMYDKYKGEWPLGYIGSYGNGVFHEQHVPSIPVHFVAFTLINGKFYGGIVSATPVNGQNYTITLTKQDATAFKKQVSAL